MSSIGVVFRAARRRIFAIIDFASKLEERAEDDAEGENDGDGANEHENHQADGTAEKGGGGGAGVGGRGQIPIVLRRDDAGLALRLLDFPTALPAASDGGSLAQAHAAGRQLGPILAFVADL